MVTNFFRDLWRLDGRHRFGLGAGGDGREVAFEHGHRLGGLHVADDGNHDVRRHIIFLVEVVASVAETWLISLPHPTPGRR